MSSGQVSGQDYRSRFEQYKAVDGQKDALISELLDRLDIVQQECDLIKLDLEAEQNNRRGLQRNVSQLEELEKVMHQGRFVVVLIDADADNYVFHEKFLARGEKGGLEAAKEFMLKVRQYLQPFVEDAETITVMAKAYANVNGLAQACVRNGKIQNVVSMNQFVTGFNRPYPLLDFIDVGPGKEEADTKVKNVLDIYVPNPQCQHVILGCYHDQGYIPFLRKFDTGTSVSEKITLLQTGQVAPGMESLRFKKTQSFNLLFSIESSAPAPTSPIHINSFSVTNSGRLRPIRRNLGGKRIDKDLSINPAVLQKMKKLNLCGWHYLREDCVQSCKRIHNYPRPLSPEEYDAVWFLTRSGGLCHNIRKRNDCDDDKCIYGHE